MNSFNSLMCFIPPPSIDVYSKEPPLVGVLILPCVLMYESVLNGTESFVFESSILNVKGI